MAKWNKGNIRMNNTRGENAIGSIMKLMKYSDKIPK